MKIHPQMVCHKPPRIRGEEGRAEPKVGRNLKQGDLGVQEANGRGIRGNGATGKEGAPE